jgi:TATA-box binding protein (TBP) (component of TFIID and TFIIIB)
MTTISSKNNIVANFEDMSTTTSTVMVYTNISFDMRKMYDNLVCDSSIEPVYTKKQRNIDKKKLIVPRGSIVSVSLSDDHHGLLTRDKKKLWCTMCRPVEFSKDGKESRPTTVRVVPNPVEGTTDRYKIVYHCEKCNETYSASKFKKISHFLNQCNIIFSIGKNPLLNMMFFKDKIKIAGCKSIDDAVDCVRLFFDKHLLPNIGADESKRMCTPPENGRFNFTFSSVMENVGFNVGFNICRNSLNELMNSRDPKIMQHVYMSEFYPTGTTPSVKIQMYSIRPESLPDRCLIYDTSTEKFEMSDTEHISYTINDGYDTFLVFSSGQCNLTGRFNSSKKANFDFFIEQLQTHRSLLEEKLIPNNMARIVDHEFIAAK